MPPRYYGHSWLSPTPRPDTPKQYVLSLRLGQTTTQDGVRGLALRRINLSSSSHHGPRPAGWAGQDQPFLHTLHTHSQSLAIAIQALPSIQVTPETALFALTHEILQK